MLGFSTHRALLGYDLLILSIDGQVAQYHGRMLVQPPVA